MKQAYKNYEIEAADDNNYTVRRLGVAEKGESKGEGTTTVIGYYSSLEHAVRRVAELCGNAQTDLKAWLDEYKRVYRDFVEMLGTNGDA